MKKRANRAKGILLISFLIFAVVVGLLVFRKYETANRPVETPPKGEQAAPAATAVMTLFFGAADGQGLSREGREVAFEDTVEETIQSVVEELVSGPLAGLSPTLPANTRVLGVRIKGEVAQIDFGRELRDNLPAGSSAEMAAVYSVVDTVAANFPKIKAVQFLIEGAEVDELGHLDLSAPLVPDLTLEKKEAPAAK